MTVSGERLLNVLMRDTIRNAYLAEVLILQAQLLDAMRKLVDLILQRWHAHFQMVRGRCCCAREIHLGLREAPADRAPWHEPQWNPSALQLESSNFQSIRQD